VDEPEGERPVQRGGDGAQAGGAGLRRQPSGRPQELGLADPGRALDEDDLALAGGDGADQALELGELPVTFEDPGRRHVGPAG
jgi:hypothetical protein